MGSSWLGLDDDFFNTSSRLSSRRARTRVSLDSTERSDYGIDAIKIDFSPRNIDFDTSALRSSILREFDSFPRKSGSSLNKTSVYAAQSKPKERQKEDVTENSKANTEYESIRELRLKLQNCQEENVKLQAVITDLTQVNKRWQKYNNDRQIYVQKLLNTIQDQQEQLNLIGERSVGQTSTSPSSGNGDEIERLRSVEQRLKEKVSILEFQVKAHRDDWEAELNEKKQALKDKDFLEQKVAQLLSPSSELGQGRIELFCQNCGRATEFNHLPPSRSRMYRTAVHLPCTSSQHSSSTSISTAGDKLVFDSRELKPCELLVRQNLSEAARDLNLKAEETSYSRSSTVPLTGDSVTQTAPSISSTTTHSSTSSLGDSSVTVKSFMQIPIAKSSSVPEGRTSSKFPELPRSSLDCFKPVHNPPLTVVNSAEQYDGVETFTAENVICLRCGEVFPPNMHLKFLNHFPKCQSNRTHKSSCEDDSKV